MRAIAKINKSVDFTNNDSNKIKYLQRISQNDPLSTEEINKLSLFPAGSELSLAYRRKIANCNEHILLMRQQQYFRDGKSHLPKSDADRIVVDFVRFKA